MSGVFTFTFTPDCQVWADFVCEMDRAVLFSFVADDVREGEVFEKLAEDKDLVLTGITYVVEGE